MRVLIFDYDGVIADSMKIQMRLFNSTMPKYGLKPVKNRKDFGRLFEGNFFKDIIDAGFHKRRMMEMHRETERVQSKISVPLFSGAKKTLKNLGRRNKMIIITSNMTKVVRRNLARNGIKLKVLGADAGLSKTMKIKSVKRKHPKAEIFYIGDTAGDIIEGKKAGVKTVAVTWGYHTRKRLITHNPDYVVSSMRQLEKLFSR